MTDDDLANPLFPTFSVNPPLKRPLIVQALYDALTFLALIVFLGACGMVVGAPLMFIGFLIFFH